MESNLMASGNLNVPYRFDEKQRAVTPGQAIVFYDGDVIAAGGWITAHE